jgi:hypothetical protein
VSRRGADINCALALSALAGDFDVAVATDPRRVAVAAIVASVQVIVVWDEFLPNVSRGAASPW